LNAIVRGNKEWADIVRASLKNYYKTSIIKRVCADIAMPEKTARSFFYKKTQLGPFDMMILVLRYGFLRESVGLAQLHNDFYDSGKKLREETGKNLILILKNNPRLTFNDLAGLLGISDRSVEYEIGKLVKMKLLRREGARKNGKWSVL
jgi:hypothetical protein